MLVKGNSGFGIELVDELTIRKSATGTAAERLKRQIEKQSQFYENGQSQRVLTPKIFRTAEVAAGFYADMEFIAAKDFVQFLSEADRQGTEDFLAVIKDFVTQSLGRCQSQEVSRAVVEKLADLEQRKVPGVYVQAARAQCDTPIHVPVGTCHGDLTLSNILFKGDKLYLLDFLDCFVESPLQDIVKLRQDTLFGWSLHLYQADFNWPRVQIALTYLDRQIEAAFRAYDWYRHYDLFQFVNLMRVLPYCTEPRTTALITEALNRMLKLFSPRVA